MQEFAAYLMMAIAGTAAAVAVLAPLLWRKRPPIDSDGRDES
jgi:hypothetical protein